MDETDLAELVDSPSPLEGKEEHKLEYIKHMITLVQQDIRNVMIYITLALGLMAFVFSQISLKLAMSLPIWLRILVFSGVALAIFSSLSFFLYIRSLHITRMKMTRCIVALDALRTRELWAGPNGVWQQNKNKYKLGQALIAGAGACFAVVVFFLLVIANPEILPT